MNLLDQAVAELTEIEQQISSLTKRREQLRAFVNIGATLYPGSGVTTVHSSPVPLLASATGNALAGATVAATGASTTAKATIVEATRDILSVKEPVHTRDLVPMLEARGIELSGENKANTVSVVLSKSKQFNGSRKHGWSLIRPQKEVTPQGAPTPAGSDLWATHTAPGKGTGSRDRTDAAGGQTDA